MKYLIDTSALVRIVRGQAAARWADAVERGLVCICEPVLVEALTIAEAKQYARVERELLAAYPWVHLPDDVWEVVRELRRVLAARSQHRGLSVADYLVAATALRLKLTVLHEDADFVTVARLVPGLSQERISGPD